MCPLSSNKKALDAMNKNSTPKKVATPTDCSNGSMLDETMCMLFQRDRGMPIKQGTRVTPKLVGVLETGQKTKMSFFEAPLYTLKR